MLLLVSLSRKEIDACGPFLEGIPEEALHNPDSGWWSGPEFQILYEAMSRTARELEVALR